MSFFTEDIDHAFSGDIQTAPLRRPRNVSKKSHSGSTLISSNSDRFVAQRSHSAIDLAQHQLLSNENSHPNKASKHLLSPSKEAYKSALLSTLFDGKLSPATSRTTDSDLSESASASTSTSTSTTSKVLRFKGDAPRPREGFQNEQRVLYSQNAGSSLGLHSTSGRRTTRVIPSAPLRVLDAPDLVDDYYLNLLDWSKDNLLAIALGAAVYVWNATSGDVTQLMSLPAQDAYVSSVQWVADGPYIAVGTSDAAVQIYDVERAKLVRTMGGHSARVSALAWNDHIVSSAGRDTMILNHDVRIASHRVATLQAHTQEVCGLKWSPDGQQLASGGNDNVLNIWNNGQYDAPAFSLTDHQAAVKALAWCPWQKNLLASGGGTADRTIRFWNTSNGTCINSIDTKSQVCSLQWSKEYREIVSSHGFSQNQLTVWKYPTMTKVAELTGHTSRVLHMAMSPDGTTVASAAADESLRIWQVFASPESKSVKGEEASSLLGGVSFR